MMAIANFPRQGKINSHGHPFVWHFDPAQDTYEFAYMGEHLSVPAGAVQGPAAAGKFAQIWTDQVYQHKASQYHNQPGGLPNGLSRQAAQALPSNTAAAQSGGTIGAAQIHHSSYGALQQQAAQYLQQQQFGSQQQLAALQRAAQIIGRSASEKRTEPLKTEGIKLGEIIAFRGWRVTPQGFLRSMSADVVWGPGEPMEGKTKSREEHNGVYAYKTAKDFLGNHEADLDVYGKVALWGDIIEHELGYRAQFAKIVSLEHFLKREAPFKIGIKELRQKYCPEAA